MDVGPYRLDRGEPRHAEAVEQLLAAEFPWHALREVARRKHRGTHIPVLIRDGQWPVYAANGIALPPDEVRGMKSWTRSLAHETFHAIDVALLTDTDRTAIHDAMHHDDSPELTFSRYGDGCPWSLYPGRVHNEAAGEAFAEWGAWRVGQNIRTSYGVHQWFRTAQQETVEEIVMAAIDDAQDLHWTIPRWLGRFRARA